MNLFDANKLENLFDSNKEKTKGLLPELIKRLIISNSADPSEIRIPSQDDIWAPGFDGIVDCKHESSVACKGLSVWEFGTSKKALSKIDDDYEKRTNATSTIDKLSTTFFLVMSKIWAFNSDRADWENSKKDWKKVRVIDASIISDWLNQTPAVCAWLLENYSDTKMLDFCSVNKAWKNFSSKTNPKFCKEMFTAGRETEIAQLIELCKSKDVVRVKGDSFIDAVGFILSCLLSDKYLREECVIINDESTYRKLCKEFKNKKFILNFNFEADADCNNSTVIPFNKQAISIKSDIELQPLRKCQFEDALRLMGVTNCEVNNISDQTNRNLLSLIRMIPGKANICRPEWAKEKDSEKLIPLLFMRVINVESSLHKKIVERISGADYLEFETAIKRFQKLEDSPLECYENFIKITNFEDVWGTLCLTTADCYYDRLIELIKEIMWKNSPIDSMQELVSETLLCNLLNNLYYFAGINDYSQSVVEKEIAKILDYLYVNKLMDILLSTISEFSESAPDKVATMIEKDLCLEENSIFIPLFKSENYRNSYSEILHALDILAQNKLTQNKTCFILKKLYLLDYNYKVSNSPQDSLENSLCLWNARGSLSLQDKVAILCKFLDEDPEAMSKFTIKLLSKKICGFSETPMFNRKAKPESIYVTDYIKAIETISNKLVSIAINIKNYNLTYNIIDNFREFSLSSFAKFADEICPQDYTSEQVQGLFVKATEEISNIKKYGGKGNCAEVKDYLSMFTTITNKTKSDDELLQCANFFQDYFRCPYITGEVEECDYEEKSEKVEKMRVSICQEWINAKGINVLGRFVGMMEDDYLWGKFLSKVVCKDDFHQAFDIIVDANKYFILAGLTDDFDKEIVVQVLQNSSDELQYILYKIISRVDLDALLDTEQKKQVYWQNKSMREYDSNVFNSLLVYNPCGLLNYYSLKKTNGDNLEVKCLIIQKIADIIRDDAQSWAVIHMQHAIENIITQVDKIKYDESFALACIELYNNRVLTRRSEGMKKYYFVNPSVFVDILNEDENTHKYIFDISFNYLLPMSAYVEEEQFMFFFDYIIGNTNETNKNRAYKMLGDILGKTIIGNDSIFPHEYARKVIEKYANDEMDGGFICGEMNSRGVRTIEDGYDQEEKANKFFENARTIELQYPRTSRLLRIIGEDYAMTGRDDRVMNEIGYRN